jgi:hypothetical protein
MDVGSVVLFLMLKTWLVSYQDSVSLQSYLDQAQSGDTIMLSSGTYFAQPSEYSEPVCGNCIEPFTEVTASVGFYVRNKALCMIGKGQDSTVLVTGAGYGLLFEQSYGSIIKYLTITGGKRDPDGNATDAGIVIKHSRVIIEECTIIDNDHRIDTVVVGIAGICGREGGELIIVNNTISGNGWDGVALYRGAHAFIADNVIQNGRGAGIGITWDASATIVRNTVSGYWKGIGAFGRSWVVCTNNIVRDNLGWGIIATGNAFMEIANNTIYHNGNCGCAVWEETARGKLVNNIITNNGWREEWVCPGVGIWLNASVENFPISYNLVWNNAAGDYEGVMDQTGLEGNICVDPCFIDTVSLQISTDSPCIDAGDPFVIDRGGTRSDIGAYGGPAGFIE